MGAQAVFPSKPSRSVLPTASTVTLTRASSRHLPPSMRVVFRKIPSGSMPAFGPVSRYTGRQMPVPMYQRELGSASPWTFTRSFRVPGRRRGVRSAKKEI